MYIENGELVYESGDRVTIVRNELEHGVHYPTGHKYQTLLWVNSMRKYCGRTVTIRGRLNGCKYLIEEDCGQWAWCNTFFEKMCDLDLDNDEEIAAPNISKFLSSFYVNS